MKKRAVVCMVLSIIVLLTACAAEESIDSTQVQAEETIVNQSTQELVDDAPLKGLLDENCPLEHEIELSDMPPEPDATPVPETPPAVHVVGENGMVYETLLGTYTWSTPTFTIEACGLHPLDAVDLLPVVETSVAGHSVCLQFDGLHMEDYRVSYWEVDGNYDDENHVTRDRNMGRIEFDLSTAGKQCVYRVFVTYPEGEAEYLFLVDYNCR